jgi:hypothetical protein
LSQILLVKKEAEWWDMLLKVKGNNKNWLKTDFDRWVDEDEQDEAGPEGNFGGDGMPPGGMGGMGGMGGGGGGGMGGMGGMDLQQV